MPGKSKIIIPVSCTEEGRWNYKSHNLYDSDEMMNYENRIDKNRSVRKSLIREQKYSSDQTTVWQNIEKLAFRKKIRSETGAMKDIYENNRGELDLFIREFPTVPNQNGILVLYENRVLGVELIGSNKAYPDYHSKLLRSFIIGFDNLELRKSQKLSHDSIERAVFYFIEEIKNSTLDSYKSIGLGVDYRLHQKNILGSSLNYNSFLIHAVVFTDNFIRK